MRIPTAAAAVAMAVTMTTTIYVHFQSATISHFRMEKPEFSMSNKRSILFCNSSRMRNVKFQCFDAFGIQMTSKFGFVRHKTTDMMHRNWTKEVNGFHLSTGTLEWTNSAIMHDMHTFTYMYIFRIVYPL